MQDTDLSLSGERQQWVLLHSFLHKGLFLFSVPAEKGMLLQVSCRLAGPTIAGW